MIISLKDFKSIIDKAHKKYPRAEVRLLEVNKTDVCNRYWGSLQKIGEAYKIQKKDNTPIIVITGTDSCMLPVDIQSVIEKNKID